MTNAIPTEGSPAEPPVPRVLRREEVLRRVPVSIDTITRMVKAGSFPAPIQLGPQAVGWLEHEVSQWILSRPPAVAALPPGKKGSQR